MDAAPFEAEREFVGHCLAGECGACRQQCGNRWRGALGWRLLRKPGRISGAGLTTLDVDQVLDREGQPVERPVSGRRTPACAGHLGAKIRRCQMRRSCNHRVPANDAAVAADTALITTSEPVTKPKHFFTFQTVASVQKSGDVVPQQSSTMMHP